MSELVSVVVPYYHVEEKMFLNCIKSICASTYNNIEIIIIDDGNEDVHLDTIDKCATLDERIVVVKHEKNIGLYQARISGVEYANGDYILFVDADDMISVDWIRLLVEDIKKNDTDLQMGNTVSIDGNGWRFIRNHAYSYNKYKEKYNSCPLNIVLEDEGCMYELHVMWNKLYKKSLWDKSLHDLKRFSRHLVMTEDILFTMILFYNAKNMGFSDCDAYFYNRNEKSSTMDNNDITKLKKDINDVVYVFSSIEEFLCEKISEEEKKHLQAFKDRYFRLWSSVIISNKSSDKKNLNDVKKKFLIKFEKEELKNPITEDGYFDSVKTNWNNSLEEIKCEIINTHHRIISFDIFDTLVVRNILNPEDILDLVSIEIGKRNIGIVGYKTLRKNSETIARQKLNINHPGWEDVNINEIYAEMNKLGVEKNICNKIMEIEIDIEKKIISERSIGKELYNLARYLGKKIVFTSDMYLERKDIEDILFKCGYKDYDDIFLSSERRELKTTGNLYRTLINELKCVPSEIIHIGDNYQADFLNANNMGIKAVLLPKSKEMLMGNINSIYSGSSKDWIDCNKESIYDYSNIYETIYAKIAYAISANMIFGNPYIEYNRNTDFNADPLTIGEFPIGMHLFNVASWLCEEGIKYKKKVIHFTSRDGYYLKRIYDICRKNMYPNAPKSSYLFVSRKALIPIQVKFFGMDSVISSNSWNGQTHINIYKTYSKILKRLDDKIRQRLFNDGYILESKFSSELEYIKYIKNLSNYVDEDQLENNFNLCREYLSNNINDDDIIFDFGYSGKIHLMIEKAIGKHVLGLYIHNNGQDAFNRCKSNNMSIHTYYSKATSMSGVINEYLLSDYRPSCIGYEKNDNVIKPIFEEKIISPTDNYIFEKIYQGAEVFTNNISRILNIINDCDYRVGTELSVPYERFLIFAKDMDKRIFDESHIEDEYFGGITKKKLVDMWNEQIKWKRLFDLKDDNTKRKGENDGLNIKTENLEWEVYKEKVLNGNIVKKALYWMIVDKSFFLRRVKEKIGGN
ncbi:MAG: glycosyltransferase [Pseudobutyrivibrio sp.]|nr:glycosyltransferase [Pseudobutyrivibrio sp.]